MADGTKVNVTEDGLVILSVEGEVDRSRCEENIGKISKKLDKDAVHLLVHNLTVALKDADELKKIAKKKNNITRNYNGSGKHSG